MKYEIQRYFKETHTWELVCSFNELSLVENIYNDLIKKFSSDVFRLICVLDL